MVSSTLGSIEERTRNKMCLAAWMFLPLLAGAAFAYPAGIDANLGLDANVGLGAGLGLDASLGAGAGVGLDASLGAGAGYGFGQGLRSWPYDNYGALTQNSLLDYGNPLAYGAEVYSTPYVYDDYPRTVDFARENYIRRYPTEFGIRDQFSVRPGYFGAPYSRYYATYFPYNYYAGGIGWRNGFF